MRESLIEVRIPKARLFLTADEIWQSLPDELRIKGLKRGKGIIRYRQRLKRIEKQDRART